jgi:hypothetical protein
MSTRLRQVLDNRSDNYLMPFLWMHDESEPVLREEIAACALATSGPSAWRHVRTRIFSAMDGGMTWTLSWTRRAATP